jgi:hypothetical protein
MAGNREHAFAALSDHGRVMLESKQRRELRSGKRWGATGSLTADSSSRRRSVKVFEGTESRSPARIHADVQREFRYQPAGGVGGNLPFQGPRYLKERREPGQSWQYGLFDTRSYAYRVFGARMRRSIDLLVWFYNRGGNNGKSFGALER